VRQTKSVTNRMNQYTSLIYPLATDILLRDTDRCFKLEENLKISKRNILRNFEYYAPHSLIEALSILDNGKEEAKVLAGGTDLLVQMKDGRARPAVIVDMKNIPELNRLECDKDGTLHIGAAVPLSKITAVAVGFSIGLIILGAVMISKRDSEYYGAGIPKATRSYVFGTGCGCGL